MPANPPGRVLTVNAGSSSIKFALFDAGDPPVRLSGGAVELGRGVESFLAQLGDLDGVTAVGHRVVHGGPKHFDPHFVTPELLSDLRAAVALDPTHLPAEIGLIEALAARLPGVPQVACFDTAFHRDLPRVATQLPIPRRYEAAGVRRYGFHGLSYAYLLEELERLAGLEAARGRVILAHLGSGASMAAVKGGRCIDTTMGLTPAGGLVMGTRTGNLDPGVLIHLMRAEGLTADGLDHLVNRESGLLGMSETSSDMRDLLARQATDPRAAEAVELFCYQARKWVGALAAALGGLDTLVFSGGVGENSPEVRDRICAGLGFLAGLSVRVIPTDEEQMIARTVTRVLASSPPPTRESNAPMPDEELRKLDAYWRAANYLSVGQIYLLANPLLREPLTRQHVKPRLLGHWGTTPGLNFVYAHLNRVIRRDDLSVLYVAGPGHGGPGLVANVYLEGTYSEVYPAITQDEAGLTHLFKQFSFPGGIPSHVAPETPGSIHEGGELGYALSHAFGAAFDNPDLIVACVVGDGEAETGPLATGWHSNKFLNPARDGAVLPILHLNGFKIANPCFLDRIPEGELCKLMEGYGYAPHFVTGGEPMDVHRQMAVALDACVAEIKRIQADARTNGFRSRPAWPMIVLRTPKGWTCPHEIDGKVVEGSWRSHQVPMADAQAESHVHVLEGWLKSYRPEELFDAAGRLVPELAELAPKGERRMGANPHANGGQLLRELVLPNYRDYAVDLPSPGSRVAEATREQGKFLRDVMRQNDGAKNFRLFSPDECASNRWQDVLEATGRCFVGETRPGDDAHLSPDGRVMEVLSEHQCQGWLEGYLLTGRHGFFSCYEAFIHIIDSMFNQHAKWLKVCAHIPWRRPIASLNYLLSSHVWRQDHNGFSHQDPGFLDHVINKKAEVVRVYLPPDANTLLSVTDHCLRSRNYVNVVVAGKQSAPQWLTMAEAEAHCLAGLGVWEWASDAGEPDVVMACCGDVPTLETLAAVELIRRHIPELKVRVVNVVNLMKLQPAREHPHGLPDAEFDRLFTADRPILFAFHGYPWLIHRLTYRRTNHRNLHVRGYKEEGTTTTPFDMCVLNQIDRFNLVKDVIARVPGLAGRAGNAARAMDEKLAAHTAYVREYGIDMPEVGGWQWGGRGPAPAGTAPVDTGADNG